MPARRAVGEPSRIFARLEPAAARSALEDAVSFRKQATRPRKGAEDGPYNTLPDWVRPRNMYDQGGMVEVTGRYDRPACACAVHESARD